jgi:hypothetical protein
MKQPKREELHTLAIVVKGLAEEIRNGLNPNSDASCRASDFDDLIRKAKRLRNVARRARLDDRARRKNAVS